MGRCRQRAHGRRGMTVSRVRRQQRSGQECPKRRPRAAMADASTSATPTRVTPIMTPTRTRTTRTASIRGPRRATGIQTRPGSGKRSSSGPHPRGRACVRTASPRRGAIRARHTFAHRAVRHCQRHHDRIMPRTLHPRAPGGTLPHRPSCGSPTRARWPAVPTSPTDASPSESRLSSAPTRAWTSTRSSLRLPRSGRAKTKRGSSMARQAHSRC